MFLPPPRGSASVRGPPRRWCRGYHMSAICLSGHAPLYAPGPQKPGCCATRVQPDRAVRIAGLGICLAGPSWPGRRCRHGAGHVRPGVCDGHRGAGRRSRGLTPADFVVRESNLPKIMSAGTARIRLARLTVFSVARLHGRRARQALLNIMDIVLSNPEAGSASSPPTARRWRRPLHTSRRRSPKIKVLLWTRVLEACGP